MNPTAEKKLSIELEPGKAVLHIDTALGRMTVRDFVWRILKQKNIRPGHVEYREGLEHATSHLWLNNRSESLRTAFLWLEALGYDIVAVKRKDG